MKAARVPAARLIDNLWGEHLPGDPAGTLSGKVTQLRRALERAEPGGRRLVVSPPPGYSLRTDAETVDAGRFRSVTARARETPDPATRFQLLSEALDLWRGPAFADFPDEPARAAARQAGIEARDAMGEAAFIAAYQHGCTLTPEAAASFLA